MPAPNLLPRFNTSLKPSFLRRKPSAESLKPLPGNIHLQQLGSTTHTESWSPLTNSDSPPRFPPTTHPNSGRSSFDLGGNSPPRDRNGAWTRNESVPSRSSARILRYSKSVYAFCRNFTLTIPVALIVLAASTYVGAKLPVFRDRNEILLEGGVGSESWVPFWLVIPLSIAALPWWYTVWANDRRARRHNRAFLSRKIHIAVEVVLLLATAVCFGGMILLVPRTEAQFEVGFPYVKFLAGLLGIHLIFSLGTLIPIIVEEVMGPVTP